MATSDHDDDDKSSGGELRLNVTFALHEDGDGSGSGSADAGRGVQGGVGDFWFAVGVSDGMQMKDGIDLVQAFVGSGETGSGGSSNITVTPRWASGHGRPTLAEVPTVHIDEAILEDGNACFRVSRPLDAGEREQHVRVRTDGVAQYFLWALKFDRRGRVTDGPASSRRIWNVARYDFLVLFENKFTLQY